nr:GNAT family N-acetyltransferase [Oscillatoria sp. HE19RPO]
MAELKRESLPSQSTKGLPRYPIPVMRIGKLAVTQAMQGKGLGETLVIDAFVKVMRFSKDIGVFGVTVDALNESAKAFYIRYGFIPLSDNQSSLFIPLKTIQSGFQQ